MSLLPTTCRLLGSHHRLALLTTQTFIPSAGQGTCYNWASYHGNSTHTHLKDWKHMSETHTKPKLEYTSFDQVRQLHASKSLPYINNPYLPSPMKSVRKHLVEPKLASHSRSVHSVLKNQGLLKPHPLLSTHHQLDRSLSVTTKSILESSPSSVQPYLRLIRFDKPIGTYLLFWPCTWSIALAAEAGHLPDPLMLAMFGAGAFIMRGAGCIINDMWDKDFDKMVERTKSRPLASGELTHFQALVFLGSQLSLALAILLQFNTYSILLGAASMGLVVTYPLAKRFTYWPQVMLGLTLNWGVLLAWSAIHGGLDASAVSLYLACVVYTVVYDTIYSHQDKYDDMLIGVKSTALKLGDQTKPWLSGFSALMVTGLTLSGYMCDQTWPFYVGVAATAAHLTHQLYTVDLNNADDCAGKFRSNTQIGVIMFLAIVFGTLMKGVQKSEEDSSRKDDRGAK